MTQKPLLLPTVHVESLILAIRGQRVMLDADLAQVYGVTTKALNQAVKRNLDRFPTDFVFQLRESEKLEVVTNCDHLYRLKFSPVLPYAFTEHGAIMAANVLNSPRAAQMSVFVVRAFIKLREYLATNRALAEKLAELERKLTERLDVHERAIVHILEQIRKLMAPPPPGPPKPPIGFQVHEDGTPYKPTRRKPRT
ncbi:MAG: ORF6N domain-containing protein [Planctomycetes bacterium]|nr:ORF6N domain-containing protein [Planctomycetota bacterium]